MSLNCKYAPKAVGSVKFQMYNINSLCPQCSTCDLAMMQICDLNHQLARCWIIVTACTVHVAGTPNLKYDRQPCET